jgi:hypothetical protein
VSKSSKSSVRFNLETCHLPQDLLKRIRKDAQFALYHLQRARHYNESQWGRYMLDYRVSFEQIRGLSSYSLIPLGLLPTLVNLQQRKKWDQAAASLSGIAYHATFAGVAIKATNLIEYVVTFLARERQMFAVDETLHKTKSGRQSEEFKKMLARPEMQQWGLKETLFSKENYCRAKCHCRACDDKAQDKSQKKKHDEAQDKSQRVFYREKLPCALRRPENLHLLNPKATTKLLKAETSHPDGPQDLKPGEEDLSDVLYEQTWGHIETVFKVSVDAARCGSHKYTYGLLNNVIMNGDPLELPHQLDSRVQQYNTVHDMKMMQMLVAWFSGDSGDMQEANMVGPPKDFMSFTEEDYTKSSNAVLKHFLVMFGLKTTGNKKCLISRLAEAITDRERYVPSKFLNAPRLPKDTTSPRASPEDTARQKNIAAARKVYEEMKVAVLKTEVQKLVQAAKDKLGAPAPKNFRPFNVSGNKPTLIQNMLDHRFGKDSEVDEPEKVDVPPVKKVEDDDELEEFQPV